MGDEGPRINIESQEKPQSLIVFAVRHGDTPYLEQIRGNVDKEEIDLTQNGVSQIIRAAETIARHIDKDKCIVWVIESPRKRAGDSADIIREHLKTEGFQLYEDIKGREVHDRLRSVDILDDEGSIVSPNHPEYVQRFGNVVGGLPKGVVPTQFVTLNSVPGLEESSSVRARALKQLSYLKRIARSIQPRIDKQLVIIQTEHEETMDPIFEEASGGRHTVKNVSGAQKGEVIEMRIPSEGDEVEVNFLNRNERSIIQFDHIKRQFKGGGEISNER